MGGPGPPDTICLEFGCQRVTRMLGSPAFLQHPQDISMWFLQQWSWTLSIGSLGPREERQWLPAPKEPSITSNIVCHSKWSQATHTEGEKEKMDAIDQQQGHYRICNHPQSAIRSVHWWNGPSLGMGVCFSCLRYNSSTPNTNLILRAPKYRRPVHRDQRKSHIRWCKVYSMNET